MKSPFVDFPEAEMKINDTSNDIYDEIKSASPFLASDEDYSSLDQEHLWQDEELVDEEESDVDDHEYLDDLENLVEGEGLFPVEPLPVPEKNPIPFAPIPPTGSFWPIISSNSRAREVAYQGTDRKFKGTPGRRFLASRTDGGRYHVGIDLWANDNDPIVACEDGRIINFYHFYRSTYALLVEHKQVVVNYGEVHKDSLKLNNLKVGDYVKAGQVIGKAGKMYHSSMLHFETYIKGTRSNKRFKVGGSPPKEVLNPTKYLLFLQRNGIQGKHSSIPNANQPGTPGATTGKWSKAIELNQYYMTKLNWIQHIYAINELLLKATGQANVSLGEEAFAEAVAVWQSQNGFSQKDSDGIIGPNTWKKMQPALGLNSEISSNQETMPTSIDKGTVSRILRYTEVIENYSKLHKINSNIVRGIIAAESAGNALTGKGTSGYKGLMQAEPTEDQLQPDVSVKSGIEKFIKFRDKILNPWLVKQGIATPVSTDENYLKACLACYNAGHVTLLKAIQYARSSGDWRKWLSPDIYKRALAFSGGYAFYKVCSGNASQKEVDVAKRERLKYRFKSNWKSDPDPAPWPTVATVINPITRCWIETKYTNTPGYLNRFIHYFKYFESNPVAQASKERSFENSDGFDEYSPLNEHEMSYESEYNIQSDNLEDEMDWQNEAEIDESLEEFDDEELSAENEAPADFDWQDFEVETDEIDNDEWEEDWLKTLETVEQSENSIAESDINYVESESPDGTSGVFSIPSLIAEDSSVPGHTCYVKIDLGKGNYPLSMTGIYVPAAFDPKQPVDAILYLHGMTGTFPGACAQMIDYWRAFDLPRYDLRIREDINASGRNVILVAPSLGDNPYKYRNDLSSRKKGLDDYLEKVLAAVNAYIVKKRFNSGTINIRNVVLAAHSAGGFQMLKMATLDNPIYGSKISECWGFDCLYGKVTDLWHRWASKNSGKKLMIYYQSTTEGNSKLLDRNSKKLSNVFVKKSPARNHYWVVKEHLKDRVIKMGQTNVSKLNFEDRRIADYNSEIEVTDFVKDWSKAIRLNRHYREALGWGQFHEEINDLLLPFSGQQNVSLGEEAFAQALMAWQQEQGFSSADADGVLGPKTWSRMQPFLTAKKSPVLTDDANGTAMQIEQTEWLANAGIQSYYPSWLAYSVKRNSVSSWGISSPAEYIESAINEWRTNTAMQPRFSGNFDGDPKRSYLNLRRLYQKKNIANPAAYFASNLVSIKFFNCKTVGHKNLAAALNAAQSALISAGHNFTLANAWSFVARTVNFNTNILSNHALGTAIDINHQDNAHILAGDEILVINAVCRPVLASGLLAETDPDVIRRASDHFRTTFNEQWVNQQTVSSLVKAIRNKRSRLDGFARNGFFNLPTVLIRALQTAGLNWGGSWRNSKDFMHFEV